MSKFAAPVLAACLFLFGWQVAGAQEPPKVVVVTRDAGGVQTASSRNPASFQQTAPAPVYPTAVAGVSVSRPATAAQVAVATNGMSREQVGALIRTAADTLEPAQMGCLVESATSGMQSGLLPADVRALGPTDLQWLAGRCQLSMADLAPVAAEFIAGPATALVMPSAPTPPVPVQQKLEAMKAATAASRQAEPPPSSSSPVNATTVGLLAVSLGGSMAAGVGIGQILSKPKLPTPRRQPRPPTRPTAPAPRVPYRYEVSRPPQRPPAPSYSRPLTTRPVRALP